VITDLVPEETPRERVQRAATVIREQLTKLTASSGLIGAKAPEFQFLVAVATPQGMGVLFALPGEEFLADIEAITAPVEEQPLPTFDPSLFMGWSEPTPKDDAP
jgi:hypothetical protein